MKSVPKGSIYPSLTYNDPHVAIEWLCRVFGFAKRLVVPNEDGGVLHSELSMGDVVVMISSPRPEARRISPQELDGVHQVLSLHILDPDAHHAHAVREGAEIVQPLEDAEFGARGYGARDLEGHCWFFSTYIPGIYWD
ncbi:MAG: hypothetical protein OSB10_00780 [Planctomycetota bacterium]|jgi:uncharacterized glyoxalase superfamily protein PhnB|nr:hypothetical protein [Planctomycetota bacterium]